MRDDLVSLTVSAADTLADETSGSIASRLWADTAAARAAETAAAAGAHRQGAPRHIRADAGTGRQAPARRDPRANLFLAGDWTATGLPATIEGASAPAMRRPSLR